LDLLTREQELSIRKRQHEQRLREQEELEKNGYRHYLPVRHSLPSPPQSSSAFSSSSKTTRPPFLPPRPLAPILKKSTTKGPPKRATSLPRVVFTSPICPSPVRPVYLFFY
jgi:hypothetical protein